MHPFARLIKSASTLVFGVLLLFLSVHCGSSGGGGNPSGGGTTTVAPVITSQPLNQSVVSGQSVSFVVKASGTPTPTFTWESSADGGGTWKAISGATSAAYTFTASLDESGTRFRAKAANSKGTATSAAALLTVTEVAVAPSINTQPEDQSAVVGKSVTFTVEASGTAPMTYQWKKGTTNIGANSASFTLASVKTTDAGDYAVTITNGAGSITSAAATLTVTPAAIAPAITTQPQNQSVILGNYASFIVAASGTPTLAYAWEKSTDAGSTWTRISGAAGTAYGFKPAMTDNGARFRAKASNNAGTAISDAATLTVTAVAPAITTQPGSAAVTAGKSATFSVVATGTAPLAYQWKKDGIAISGATSANCTIASVAAVDAGDYTVTITNSAGGVTSNAAHLTVLVPVTGVTLDCTGLALHVGDTAALTAITSPADASNPGITWESNNPNGVTIDAGGRVLAVSVGDATLTATTVDGRKTATCMVTVAARGKMELLAGDVEGVGSADGIGEAARFYYPKGVAMDTLGNVYVADTYNHIIRKITPLREVTILAGLAGISGSDDDPGTGDAARFNMPSCVAVDTLGNVYVADTDNHTIRKITSSGVVTTVAGLAGSHGSTDGVGTAARFYYPCGVAADTLGNVYVADAYNHTIRKITPLGEVTTLAGLAGNYGSIDDAGTAARFFFPMGMAVDGSGNVYVADYRNHIIRKISPSGEVTTIAGSAGTFGSTDGTGSVSRFSSPCGVAVDEPGNVYVADTANHTIRKITSSGVVTTFAGLAGASGSADGTGSVPRFNGPYGVAVNGAGNVYVADTSNSSIREISSAGVVTTLAGPVQPSGSNDGNGSSARFYTPNGVTVDLLGNIYVADASNNTIREISSSGLVTTLAGLAGTIGTTDDTGSAARFSYPNGVAVDTSGNVYVADTYNQIIRKIAPAGEVTTPVAAQFGNPYGVAVDTVGNVYVASNTNHAIYKFTSSGVVTTLAGLAGTYGFSDDPGDGSAARFHSPSGLTVDAAGNVYVADTSNQTIRKIAPSGAVTTLAGSAGRRGFSDGAGSAARFDQPSSVAVDEGGNVYVADLGNATIRKIMPSGEVTTIAGVVDVAQTVVGSLPASISSPRGVAVAPDGALIVTTLNGVVRISWP